MMKYTESILGNIQKNPNRCILKISKTCPGAIYGETETDRKNTAAMEQANEFRTDPKKDR
jgi:hypothetical protein